MFWAEWVPWGPAFLTDEQGDIGKLGVDYTDSVDTRWEREAVLGPLVTVLDCSAAGGTPANTNGFTVAPTSMQANGPYLYAIRGTKWAKIKLESAATDLTLKSDGSETALGSAATSILYTSNAAGTEEISIGMRGTAFRVITAVGSGATDTHAANTAGAAYSIIAKAASSSANRDICLLGAGTSNTQENRVAQITLAGTATMKSTATVLRATIAGEPIRFTGFALDGDKWLLGTSNGPYYLDSTFQEFRPLIEELDNDLGHCNQMGVWGALNSTVIIPLKRSTRTSKNLSGRSIGPEVYRENGSPLQGTVSAFTSSERWGYFVIYNPVLDQSWICAARPTFESDWHQYPLSFFPIAKLAAGVESNAAYWVGTQGGRTLPMVVFGNDSNVCYLGEGRLDKFQDDTSYKYASSGTLYLTRMKRQPESYKNVLWFDVETSGCSSTQTVTLYVETTDRYGNAATTQVGGPISSNGIHRLRVSSDAPIDMARDIKPKLVFATGSSGASPKVIAKVRMAYQLKEMAL